MYSGTNTYNAVIIATITTTKTTEPVTWDPWQTSERECIRTTFVSLDNGASGKSVCCVTLITSCTVHSAPLPPPGLFAPKRRWKGEREKTNRIRFGWRLQNSLFSRWQQCEKPDCESMQRVRFNRPPLNRTSNMAKCCEKCDGWPTDNLCERRHLCSTHCLSRSRWKKNNEDVFA